MKPTIHEVPCPHAACTGTMRVGDSVLAGTYTCKCKAVTVKLSWATYIAGGRKPYLTIAEKEGEA